MKKLELKIPPLLAFLLFAVSMWVLDRFTPGHVFNTVFRYAFIAVALVAAAVFGVGGIGRFRKAGTTVNPMNPERSSILVTNGVYRFSRNPMYLALLLLLLALGFALSNLYSLALAVLFIPFMNRFQVRPEERTMEKLFSKEYAGYCKRVRRWF